jgi:hypothetical protein
VRKIFSYLAGTILEFSGGINGKDLFSIIQTQGLVVARASLNLDNNKVNIQRTLNLNL